MPRVISMACGFGLEGSQSSTERHGSRALSTARIGSSRIKPFVGSRLTSQIFRASPGQVRVRRVPEFAQHKYVIAGFGDLACSFRPTGAHRADVVLPGGMTGAQVAAQARGIKPNLKVLFTTGYARNAIVHHGRLDQGVQLITKPFTISDLATRVRGVLDGLGRSGPADRPDRA